MLNWLFGKSLNKALATEKVIFIQGVRFIIKKLNPLDVAAGYNVLLQSYTTYDQARAQDVGNKAVDQKQAEKIREHYKDIFLTGIVHPKLSTKQGETNSTYVYDLFNNWDLCEALYMAILEHTYGKKKFKV